MVFLGLIVSGITAYFISSDPSFYKPILYDRDLLRIIFIFELVVVFLLVKLIREISTAIAIFLYLIFCTLSGSTISVIFLVFTFESIALTFFITAIMFGLMSIYGYFTKIDLSTLESIFLMGLFGIIITTIINFFLNNSFIEYIVSIIAIIIFMGLTAYDTQKIKEINIIGNAGTREDTNESILGALNLYIDFISLLLRLLRFTGKRR